MTKEEWKQAYEEGAPVVHTTTFLRHYLEILVPANSKVSSPLFFSPATVEAHSLRSDETGKNPKWTLVLDELRRLTPEEIVLHEREL